MKKHRDDDDDYKSYTMDGNLEQRVKAWTKWAEFRHVTTSPCSKCGKGMYAFTPEDTDGFCTHCFSQRWIVPKHKRGHAGIGANAHKKQKGKNVEQGEDQK